MYPFFVYCKKQFIASPQIWCKHHKRLSFESGISRGVNPINPVGGHFDDFAAVTIFVYPFHPALQSAALPHEKIATAATLDWDWGKGA